LRCSDCHNSDEWNISDDRAARGPHGSKYAPILERRYETADYTPESQHVYALCYKCHDRDTLFSARSGFPEHRSHVIRENAPCSACHDPHGVNSSQGTAETNSHLINFDIQIVHASRAGLTQYISSAPRTGACSLECHGKNHADESYGPLVKPSRSGLSGN
jgi:hypothetical protein